MLKGQTKCPYNPAHVMPRDRLIWHISKGCKEKVLLFIKIISYLIDLSNYMAIYMPPARIILCTLFQKKVQKITKTNVFQKFISIKYNFFINRQGEDLEIDYDSLAAAVDKQFNIQKEEKKLGNAKTKPQELKGWYESSYGEVIAKKMLNEDKEEDNLNWEAEFVQEEKIEYNSVKNKNSSKLRVYK